MGLLDQFFGNADQTQALGLLGAAGMKGRWGDGMLLAQQHLSGSRERQLQDQVRQMQLRKAQMEMQGLERDNLLGQQTEEAARASFNSPERANALSMGPMPDGSNLPQVSPGFDQKAFLDRMFQLSPLKAMELQQSMASQNKPLTVAPGASLVDPRTMKPVFTAPKEEATPSSIREYQFAQQQGFKGSYEQWATQQKRAGANSVNLSVNTEKSLLNEMASGLGKGLTTAKDGAQAALGTIGTVNRLMDALDSGQVMAGPGTTFRQFGLQVGNMLGVGGRDAQEKLLNTRQAVQSLAQLELDAAQQMKGQGQITEAERAIIRRAASGDIDGMTAMELRLLGGVLDRTARTKIRSFNTQVKPLMGNPNAAPLAPFLNVEEPSERQAPNIMRFDAQGNPVR